MRGGPCGLDARGGPGAPRGARGPRGPRGARGARGPKSHRPELPITRVVPCCGRLAFIWRIEYTQDLPGAARRLLDSEKFEGVARLFIPRALMHALAAR